MKWYWLIGLWGIALCSLSYGISRNDFPTLIVTYTVAFVAYWFMCIHEKIPFRMLLGVGLVIRLIICFAFPAFSDDIYRFWWDGKLIAEGFNPFDATPRDFMTQEIWTSAQDKEVFKLLNSPDYYSVYPPICQAIFSLSYWLSPKNLYSTAVILKLILFLFDFGTIYILSKIFVTQREKLLWYVLNPLIIIEFCGNAHFEAAMIFFLVLVCYMLQCVKDNRIYLTESATFRTNIIHFFSKNNFGKKDYLLLIAMGAMMACSVASKLLTLIFVPLVIRRLGFYKGLVFGISLTGSIVILFAPYWTSDFVAHFSESVRLYFQKFEFNASVYYLARSIGQWYFGYNPILLLGRVFSFFTITVVAYLFFRKENFYQHCFWLLVFYLCVQTTVHPWYVSTLVLLSLWTPYRFAMLWSGLIFLSYAHYWDNIYQENYILISVEYLIVFFFALFEYKKECFLQKKS